MLNNRHDGDSAEAEMTKELEQPEIESGSEEAYMTSRRRVEAKEGSDDEEAKKMAQAIANLMLSSRIVSLPGNRKLVAPSPEVACSRWWKIGSF